MRMTDTLISDFVIFNSDTNILESISEYRICLPKLVYPWYRNNKIKFSD